MGNDFEHHRFLCIRERIQFLFIAASLITIIEFSKELDIENRF